MRLVSLEDGGLPICRFCNNRGCLVCDAARIAGREQFVREQAEAELNAVRAMLHSERFQKLARIVLAEDAAQSQRDQPPAHAWDRFDFLEIEPPPVKNQQEKSLCADSTDAASTAIIACANAKSGAADSTSPGRKPKPTSARKAAMSRSGKSLKRGK